MVCILNSKMVVTDFLKIILIFMCTLMTPLWCQSQNDSSSITTCPTRSGDGGEKIYGCHKNKDVPIICSHRGTCVCDQCQCDTRPDPSETIYGRFCECDNFTCARDGIDGKICSGPAHGLCQCGQCLCHPQWSGIACECAGDNSVKCHQPLEEFKDCVHCTVFSWDDEDGNNCTQKCLLAPGIEIVHNFDVTGATSNGDGESGHYYTFLDDHNCKFYFAPAHDINGKLFIQAKRVKDCPTHQSRGTTFWIVFGMAGTVFVVYGLVRFLHQK